MNISIVVAMDENRAIGYKGDLLWHLPADMKRFKAITLGHHVLMGRKTSESIPDKYRPLPGRVNIIVTSNRSYRAEGSFVVDSLDAGIKFAKDNGESELMIIGGGEIYRQCIPICDTVYLTVVKHVFEKSDVFFPNMPATEWSLSSQEHIEADAKNAHAMMFQQWSRICNS